MSAQDTATLFLIWSFEHKAWWRADEMGYTPDRAVAGHYDLERAVQICFNANRSVIKEVIVPVEQRPIMSEAGSREISHLTGLSILESLNQGMCPDCGAEDSMLKGPEGGLMTNIRCAECGSEFNYCPPCFMAAAGIAQRIGRKAAA